MFTPLLVLLACTPSDPAGAGGVGGGSGADVPVEIDPSWSAEAAMAALQAALDDGLPQPAVARDAFLQLIEEGQDETCPGTTDFDGSNPLGCTSEAGYLYAGISQYREDDSGWALGGDFTIQEPDGKAFDGAGHLNVHSIPEGWMSEFSGSWSHEGGADWLDEGRGGMFFASGMDGRVDLDGGLDLGGTYVHFDQVSVAADHLFGRVGVRDAAGAWWWLEVQEDGCGRLSFGTEEQGEGCVDLRTPIEAWATELDP